ncbi:MAG: HAD hydrolase-like protein, partial [Clostridia bacterium]|nr:HAD hydrolase-like protein [Clostridia bacterium]
MKAIVFDMDGVLFDTEKVYFEAWHRVAEEMQLDVEEVLLLCAGHNAADI